MKNILIVGLGSIGQRHYRNLKKIDKNINFFSIRKKRNSPELNKFNQIVKKRFISNKKKIKEISLKELENQKIDLALVTNPTSLHIKTATELAKKKINVFLEKPISNNIEGVDNLLRVIKRNKLICAVGFQTRYDDLLQKIKKIINTKKFGNIEKSYIEHKHFLPYHHKYEDYKIGYAAKKSLGGGVLLCFSHEFDYANFLFGSPKYTYSSLKKSNKLKIDVESSALVIAKYQKKFETIFDLDFLKKRQVRSCKIQFEKAFIEWDLIKNNLKIFHNSKIKFIRSKFKTRDSLFNEQLKQVLKSLKLKKNPKSNIYNGIENLKNILEIKKISKLN
tara:strand:- start:1222 stop:2223 length:1002 start_codon:yes stop_codon:yes gene_type:complete